MKVISLFSGAGGLDLGLIQAGHKIVWANDCDSDCVTTYKNNIGDHIVLGEIEGIASNQIPNADIVVGGFPCQGFSVANRLRFEEDERNRLYLEFWRVIKDKQPKWFIAENVRGVLSLGNGEAIKKIERDFSSAGYRVKKQLFNTADFGVPQSRWRVIITGTRSDLSEEQSYQYPQPTHSNKVVDGLLPWVSIGAALAGIPEPDEQHELFNHECSKYKVANRNFTGHRVTAPDRPSPTILARGNGKGGVCAIPHPGNHRRMSIREQAILQTFPNEFSFFGKLNSCYRQVGNAVPVEFARHLGKMFYTDGSKRKK